jgi:hypothetical protein
MLEQRRRALSADGRTTFFVDLLAALGPQAGVAWFNDMRHFSRIGHRRASELICQTLAH